jgi:tRNA wybutosine-synthesizing protein 2
MGYIFDTEKYLPAAFRILKKKGIIHYHCLLKKDEFDDIGVKLDKIAKRNGYRLKKVLKVNIVKSYAPKVYHVVVDAEFTKA